MCSVSSLGMARCFGSTPHFFFKMNKSLSALFALSLALLLPLGQVAAKKKKPLTPNQEIEQQLLQYMDSCKTVGMSIVLVKGSKVVYQNALGYKNLETRQPLALDDIFRIASISKSFSAASVLQLQEAGKIRLDDDVNQYLPFSLRNPLYPDIPITVRHLLSHTSSMQDRINYSDDRFVNPSKTTSDTIAMMFSKYAPGWGYKYCNRGLNLMGCIIEKASGERFDNYVRQHILLPMGISNAGFNLDSVDNSKCVNLYKYRKRTNSFELGGGYSRKNEYKLKDGTYRPVLDGCYWSPTGGMRISAPDLAKWMMTLRDNGMAPNGHRILSEKSARLMKTPVTSDSSGEKQYYCLNLYYQQHLIAGRTMIGHTGTAHGLRSCMFFDKESDWGIVCLCSSEDGRTGTDATGKDSGCVKVYYDVANYLFKRFKDVLLAK